MIPKRIHCCWFGGTDLPRLARRCIASWRVLNPGYEVTIWTEQNYDVNQLPYTKEAYALRKYAFVSDYARFDLLSRHGGIYMDVDVEVIRPLDDFLLEEAFTGFEHDLGVAPGLMLGSVPGHQLIEDLRSQYTERSFTLPDGSLDLTTVVDVTTGLLVKKGLRSENVKQVVEGLAIYPISTFCPMNRHTGAMEITAETYAIHHYADSWNSPLSRLKKKLVRSMGPDLTGRAVAIKRTMRNRFGR